VDWEARLATKIADSFACELIGRPNQIYRDFQIRNEMYYSFIGCGAAPEVAQYAFTVLQRQCVAGRTAHMKKQPKNCKAATKTARGDMFALAWVYAVGKLIERFAGTEANTKAIALYMEQHHPALTKTAVTNRTDRRNVRDSDAMAGLVAGESAQLNRGVAGAAERKLIAS
jgi:hypothetical protein